MCYDVESSLSAWILANSIALYLFYRNERYDRWNSGFIAIFTTIQLLESGIWWTMDDPRGVSNELLTKMILLVLLSQPLAQTYLGAKNTGSSVLYFLSFVYFGILLWALLFRVGRSSPGEFYTDKGPGGHLVWHDTKTEGNFIGGRSIFSWMISGLYLTGLFLPLLFAKDYRGMPLFVTGIGTALYSSFFAKSEEFSSMWCYYAVLYAVVAVMC